MKDNRSHWAASVLEWLAIWAMICLCVLTWFQQGPEQRAAATGNPPTFHASALGLP